MMMTLLVLKSKIKNFYEKTYRVTRGVLKCLIVFSALLLITGRMDYNSSLAQYWLIALEAAVCAVTPDGVSMILLLLVTCAEISAVSVLLALMLLMITAVYILLFGRFDIRQYYMLILVPLLSALHIGYVVPIVSALFVSPVFLPSLIMGILLVFLLQGVEQYASVVLGVGRSEDVLSPLKYVMDGMLQNQMMYVVLIASCLSFICIYVIRRRSYRHGSQIAILAGAVLLMAVMLISNIMIGLGLNIAVLFLQVALSMALAYVIQFFHMTLDYHGTKKLQFEDDEYYYYVTAVPKYKVTVVDRTVTRIVPDDPEENVDLKEELDKALQEEEESDSDVIS